MQLLDIFTVGVYIECREILLCVESNKFWSLKKRSLSVIVRRGLANSRFSVEFVLL